MKKNKGFTLIELIVVITIIGILSAVLIPSISGYVDKAKESAALQEAKMIETAYLNWIAEYDELDEESKEDFAKYLEFRNIISDKQSVSEFTTDDNKIEIRETFVFTASNQLEVKCTFETSNLKMEIISR